MLATTSTKIRPERCNVSMASILFFLSIRLARAAPRILLGLGFFVSFMIMFPGFTRISDYSLRIQQLLPCPSSKSLLGPGDQKEGGGLRIVVFGSPDFATGSAQAGAKQRQRGWTEQLCDELHCTSYLSFVPQTDGKPLDPSLASKEKYRLQMTRFLATKLDASKPAFNYTFLEEQYPVPSQHRDVEEQVTAFLESMPPTNPPKETVWIFGFGIWDVWHLAALPRSAGEMAIDGMANVLFGQIERLYEASLLENSPAFSNFWGLSDESLLAKVRNGTVLADTRKETEMFRLLIPKTLDPSLTPAWNSLRPSPPPPHSKAEHVKNAAYLTDRWNANMQAHMDKWKRSWPTAPRPAVQPSNDDGTDRTEAKKRSDSTTEDDGDILVVPYPRKEGQIFDAPGFVLDAIIERQLRSTNLQDTLHRGNRSESEPIHFREVERPCSAEAMPTEGRILEVLTGVRTGKDVEFCEKPEQHLFYTPVTIAARAIREIAGRAAGLARKELYLAEDEGAVVASVKVKRGSESSFAHAPRSDIR